MQVLRLSPSDINKLIKETRGPSAQMQREGEGEGEGDDDQSTLTFEEKANAERKRLRVLDLSAARMESYRLRKNKGRRTCYLNL